MGKYTVNNTNRKVQPAESAGLTWSHGAVKKRANQTSRAIKPHQATQARAVDAKSYVPGDADAVPGC